MQCFKMLSAALEHAFAGLLLKFLAAVMSMKSWAT